MTPQETSQILRRMKLTWPTFRLEEEDLALQLEIWNEWLDEYTYQQICDAIKTFKGNKWPPGPAEILGTLQPQDGGAGEPWMKRRKTGTPKQMSQWLRQNAHTPQP